MGSKASKDSPQVEPKMKKKGSSMERDSMERPPLEKQDSNPSVEKSETSEKENEEEVDMHPSWNDEELYNRDAKSKVTKDDFELLNVVGKGSFGKVMQVKKKDDGKIYAMKVLRKDAIIQRKQVAHTKAEKSILQKIQHPFIVKLNYAFQTKDKLYMILDFIDGGELFFHLKKEGRFSEPRVVFYAAQIASAMEHLHGLGIVYRDLKPENILLDETGYIIITDFGLSKEVKPGEGTTTFCGTPEYLAPEVLKGQGHSTPVDWWSLGTLIYEMLTGLPPFYSNNITVMYQKIMTGELKFPSYVSPAAQDLLKKLLDKDPDKRLGTKGASEVKKHDFFKDIDWNKLVKKEIEAPFKPKVSDKNDIGQIDTIFTNEKPVDSLVENSAINGEDNTFEGFTFVAPTAMEGIK